MIAIVDYKAGNLTSVKRALEHLGHRECEITDSAERIRAADRVILPGVGAAGATMENLRALGLAEVLTRDVAAAGKPFLGICIGIQVLFDRSEEDAAACLGIVGGEVRRYPKSVDGRPLKLPQIGWNRVRQVRPHPIFKGVQTGAFLFRQFVLPRTVRSRSRDRRVRPWSEVRCRDRARERHRDAVPP